jgi:hypothetical protein
MQSLKANHDRGVPTTFALPSSVKKCSCDECLLHKANVAPRNSSPCPKPARALENLCLYIWDDPMNVPSPHGLRHCLFVIDHHTKNMWVQFLKSKDDTCSEQESISGILHMYARYHSSSCVFAHVLKFDSDSVFVATVTRQMCGRLGVGV